jgi:hypothetical protein
MTTTYAVRVVCDERRAPDCLGERVETVASLLEVDFVGLRLQQEGWVRGYGSEQTYDVCPACAAVAEREEPEG